MIPNELNAGFANATSPASLKRRETFFKKREIIKVTSVNLRAKSPEFDSVMKTLKANGRCGFCSKKFQVGDIIFGQTNFTLTASFEHHAECYVNHYKNSPNAGELRTIWYTQNKDKLY